MRQISADIVVKDSERHTPHTHKSGIAGSYRAKAEFLLSCTRRGQVASMLSPDKGTCMVNIETITPPNSEVGRLGLKP